MEGNNQCFPEDEEDLETLRLAALQSLKRKSNEFPSTEPYFNTSPRNKRGKFPRSLQGRQRNGHFNGWSRNSNLIAVPVLQDPEEPQSQIKKPEEPPKLILPQDRYCKVEKSPEKTDNSTSKFDRYNNSEGSDSDSEDERKSPLKRSNSLEELMAELENEIQGGSTVEEKANPKKKPKMVTPPPQPIPAKENLEPVNLKPFRPARKWRPQNRPPPFAPPPFRDFVVQPPVFPIFPVYEAPPPIVQPPPLVPIYEPRPLSPLRVSTENYGVIMAPLSPRSAAFVLENRAIVEKRKRRSYSRSPTPVRLRRSTSPKRCSLSPRRISRTPPRRRSLSPSPIRKRSPPHIKERTDEDKTKKEDPVLEARRRRFERSEPITEGVVRIKKTVEEQKEKSEEQLEEEALLADEEEEIVEDAILLEPKIDELFSDEESDSDNEGRFKTKVNNENKSVVAVLPFTKLVNGTKEVKKDLQTKEEKSPGRRREKRRERRRMRSKGRGKRTSVPEKVERKIEIKIRNPGKYKEEEKKEVEEKKEEAGANVTEGDLRAQLSRKRAERQKHPLPDVVPSRLLQSALQDVGCKKQVKNDKNNKEETTNVETKLPIRLRLGAASTSEMLGKNWRIKGGLNTIRSSTPTQKVNPSTSSPLRKNLDGRARRLYMGKKISK